jgi:anaerobic ribonucleoside-triphosphate reductase activating protein
MKPTRRRFNRINSSACRTNELRLVAGNPLNLRIHHLTLDSRANGPGVRAVVWVQGCSLGCPGCFNPQTHPREGGEVVQVSSLLERLINLEGQIEGLTISGGEPLQQLPALVELLQGLRRSTRLSVLAFTGFTWTEVQRLPRSADLLASLDVLIAGRFDASQRLAEGLIGSSNKMVHFLTPRYNWEDLQLTPPAEVWITSDGEIELSGIDPLRWQA